MIAIGLLALSVASCQKHKKKDLNEWQSSAPTYYVNNGNGYSQGGVSPFWVFYAYSLGRNGSIMSSPTYAYRHANGSFYTSRSGSKPTVASNGAKSITRSSASTRTSVSRGGFGASGRSVSA